MMQNEDEEVATAQRWRTSKKMNDKDDEDAGSGKEEYKMTKSE